ncbi:MAG TPA: hypothetical protein ENG33_09440 [Chloroflexi bacterium]|nr:hypothetical protein [Chloroflexota bacterium]
MEAKAFSGVGGFPLFRYSPSPFSGGSDHYILSDPTVGIPTPMVIQWPDRFYHTDQDTPDKSDPKMLWRVGTLASSYAYFLANASPEDVACLGYTILARLEKRLSDIACKAIAEVRGKSEPQELASLSAKTMARLEFQGEVAAKVLASLQRLWPDGQEFIAKLQAELADAEARLKGRFKDILDRKVNSLGLGDLPAPAEELSDSEREAANLIPIRLHKGPPASLAQRVKALPETERERWYRLNKEHKEHRYVLPVTALYWSDGKRTLLEIFRLVEMETGLSASDFLLEYFRFLEKMGLVELRYVHQAIS